MSSVDRKCADSAAAAAVNRNEDKSRAMSQKFRGDKKAWRVSQIHSNEDMQKMMAANQASAGAGEQIIRIQTPIKIQAPEGGEIQQVVQAPPKPPTPETKA